MCRWMGKGVTKAVENVNKIIGPALIVSLLCPGLQINVHKQPTLVSLSCLRHSHSQSCLSIHIALPICPLQQYTWMACSP